MSKFKVWIFLYIVFSAINLNISYADSPDLEINKVEKITEINL